MISRTISFTDAHGDEVFARTEEASDGNTRVVVNASSVYMTLDEAANFGLALAELAQSCG